jgi:hypothetical protein
MILDYHLFSLNIKHEMVRLVLVDVSGYLNYKYLIRIINVYVMLL